MESASGTVLISEIAASEANRLGGSSDGSNWESWPVIAIQYNLYQMCWNYKHNGSVGYTPLQVHGGSKEAPKWNILMHDGHVEMCDVPTISTGLTTNGILRYNKP